MQSIEESMEQPLIRISVVQNTGEYLDTISNESFSPDTRETSQNWKQNWFVKNVIVEFPIIGDFFHEDSSVSNIMKRVGKSTSMLLGGSAGMMLDFIPVSENDDMAAKIAKNSVKMAIGMWVSAITYNTVLSLGYIGYNCIKGDYFLKEFCGGSNDLY